jgi:hypothetical protein
MEFIAAVREVSETRANPRRGASWVSFMCLVLVAFTGGVNAGSAARMRD